MAKITLRIEADASAVSTALANLKKEAQALAGQKIDLGIDANAASAIAKAAKAMADLERAQASSARASAQVQTQIQRTIQAHEKTAQAIEKTRQAEEKTAQSSNKLAEARERTYQAEERTTQAFERTYQAQEKTAQGATNLAIAQEKTEQSANRLATEQERTARATAQSSEAATTASGAFNALSVALGNIAARAFHLVISKITQGIREAVAEMKDVDTQLTNISKVSGITGKALADMGERAYETASKYGVAADEYLSAVYTFQKAGLGESAEAMGELAVKTMLVGDTTADVASKFLISANAAWKMGGDMERLNQIVDEADYINNNYATDLGKLSEGLPRVAAVAAQAGMSAEETLAAIGTITAVTQESGTKSATALRALILNIEGQIGEFMDETGETFTVTEESVKSMQGLMEKYAKAELDAAKASGELINPMTAIKALFEGMANSDLNDQELFALLSGMGGKLRTNQLTALVENYEMFDEMLKRIADSAGTADNEIALMMESWERKTQVLKNTWTEFVAHAVNTDEIKGALEGLTGLISGLDDLLFSTGSERTQSKYASLKDEYDALLAKGTALTQQEQLRLEWIEKQTAALKEQAAQQANIEARNSGRRQVGTNPDGTPLYYETAMYESLTAGWSNAMSGLAEGRFNFDEYIAKMRETIQANQDYYDSLVQWKEAGADLSDEQEKFITDFEAAEKIVNASSLSLRENANGYWEIVDAQGNVLAWTDKYVSEEERAAKAAEEEAEAIKKAAEHQEELNNQNENTREWADYQQQMAQAMADYDAGIAEAQTATDDLAGAGDEAASATSSIAEAAKSIDFLDAIAQAQELAAVLAAGGAAAGGIHVDTGGGGGGGAQAATGTKNAAGGPTLVNELGPELISENGKAYIINGGKPGIVNLSKGAIVLTAKETREALKGGRFTTTMNAAASGLGDRDPGSHRAEDDQRARQDAIDRQREYDRTHPYNPPNTHNRNNKKKGKSKKDKAKEAGDKLKEKLANLDKQAELALNKKQYDKAISIYNKCISLIKKQISVYKKAGFKGTSNEILDLQNMIYDYKAKIESAQKAKESDQQDALAGDTADTLSNLDSQADVAEGEGRYDDATAVYDQAMSLIDQQIEAYRAAGYDENSNEILDLKKKRQDYEKKRQSAEKAKADAIKSQIEGDSKEILGNREARADLAHAEGRYADEIDAYQDAMKVIDQQIEAFKAAGYDENSDEVLALRKQRKEYEDKITDAEKALIEGDTAKVISNLNGQASLARAEKRYADEKKLYEEAMALIDQQIEAFRKAGYSETSDEMLELKSQRKAYEDKIEDATKAMIEGDTAKIINNLNGQASLARAEKRYEDEKRLYEEAMALIDQQIAAYKAAGYSDTSDEVLALRSSRKDYEDKLLDVTKAIIEGETGTVLSNLSSQAALARAEKRYAEEAKLYEQVIDIIQQQIDAYRAAGYSDTSDEILALRSSLLDYQDKRKSVEQAQWDELLNAIQSDIDAQNQAEQFAERQKAIEDAQKALENLDKQRTVRVYNAATGQWEWVSDAKSRESAQSSLESAQKSYDDFIRSKAISDIQRAKEEGLAFDMGNLGPQVTSDVLSRLNSPEVQEYAKMLDAIYGGVAFRELTGVLSGSSSATDSHDTVYNFGNVTLSEAQAESMSVADLARKLSVLKIS